MNILLLAQEYPPESAMGGVGSYMHSIAHAYTQMGHTVHVVSTAAPGQASYTYMQDRVQVHRIRRWKFELPVLRRIWHAYFPWTKHQLEYAFGLYGALARIVRVNKIEIIEATELWAEGLFYSFTRQVPILIRLHTPLFVLRALNQMRATRDWRIVDALDKEWTRRADRIIAGSRSLADIVAERYHLDAQNIPIIPVPVNLERFPALPPALDDAAPLALYTGQLEPRKGVFTLVEAIPRVMAEIPNARFVFVGNDRVFDGRSTRAALEAQLNALGVARYASFTGALPNTELGAQLRRAHVCVFPSQWEAVGIACLEAMASARAVIASRVGGLQDMIQDQHSGLLIPPGDPAALATALVELLKNPTRARALGIQARARVEQSYAPNVIARRNLAEYDNTLRNWNAKHGVSQVPSNQN
ncbi:MAG: glycosyl transferase family 1 [Chloroflexota bacterium]|nr:MAG: glycosyl transferase family 1 [Chloroflexota bacterium]